MIKNIMQEQLKKAASETGYKNIEPEVLSATDEKFGDYYSTVALKLKRFQDEQNPVDIAKEIVAKLPKNEDDFTADVAPNGFINFRLTTKFLRSQVQKIIEESGTYGRSELGKGKKARVEFVSANPTGPLHIGNARGGPLGDAIANVLEFSGYKVLREYLNNDRGNQVRDLGNTIAIKSGKLEKEGELLAYDSPYTDDLAVKVSEKINVEDKPSMEVSGIAGELGVKILLQDILIDLKNMGIEFDSVVHESELYKKLPEVLEEFKKKGLLEGREGATWFVPKGEKTADDKSWVVIKSDGSYTYFAADIAYHKEKFESGYDLVVDVFGSNTSGHVPKLLALAQTLDFDLSKFKTILYQFVRVKRGNEVVRMSKRAGDFVTAREVLDEVGKDAFRFTMLMYDQNTHMDFDLEQAKKQSEENPVYYVQYAHARCSNILKKAQKKGFRIEGIGKENLDLLKTNPEMELIRKLIKFPELVQDIATSDNFPVHLLASNTLKVADELNRFYEKVRVVGEEKEITRARLDLILATKTVLHNSLQLMGISSPEYMEKL